MNSYNRANISSKVPSTGSTGQVFSWIQPICVNHEVSVRKVDLWCLASVASVEILRQSSLLNDVNGIVIEPRATIEVGG